MTVFNDITYIRMLGPRLQGFKQVDDFTFNTRCFICGDSQKSKSKKRGYFFKRGDMMLYFCHNCCDKSIPIPKLLKLYFPDLFEEYRKDKLKEKFGEDFEEVKAERERQRQEEEERRAAIPKTLDTDPDFGIDVHELPSEHPANVYIQNRKLPDFEVYYTEGIKRLAKQISSRYEKRKFPEDGRIVIPHRDQEGKLLGVTCRAIADSDLKYVHLRVNQDNFFVYGLQTVHFSQQVIVTEGQFDSLFLNNAIAVGGSAMKKVRRMISEWNLDPNNFTFVWDNNPRNRDIAKMIRASIISGFNTVVWEGCPFKGEDINDMVVNGNDPEVIQDWIMQHSRNESDADQMRLLLRLKSWTKCKL